MWVCSLGFVVYFWQHLYNSIQDKVGRVTLSQPAGRKDPSKMTQQQSKHNYIQRANTNGIKGIPRASSSGDQGDHITESHRLPTIEDHTTNAGN